MVSQSFHRTRRCPRNVRDYKVVKLQFPIGFIPEMIGIRNDTNRLVFFCCIMTLWNAFVVCAPLEDGTNRPLCKLTVPTNARASILRPRESSSITTKSQSENDFECDKKVFSLNDVTINQKWMILLECEPGYSLIGKQLLTCTQDSYGTSVWDGMSPACGKLHLI